MIGTRSSGSVFWFLGLGVVASVALSVPAVAGETGRLLPLDAMNRVDAEGYTVAMKAVGSYGANQPGMVELTLASKSGYHVNEKYPIKFKLADPAPDGVSYPKPVLKRADGECDTSHCTFQVPFVPTRAGKVKVAGKFAFSVCSEGSCLMDRLDLELDVDVP